MATGKVKWFNYSAIQNKVFKSLAERDLVSFDIEKVSKGLDAINVIKL